MIGEEIFTQITTLKKLDIKINGYVVLPEDAVSFDIKWSFEHFGVTGTLVFKDSYDLFSSGAMGSFSLIDIYAQDIYSTFFKRTFKVIGENSKSYNGRFKLVKLDFIDQAFFKMRQTYKSKGFVNKTYTEALNEYLKQYDIDKLLLDNKITKDFDDTLIKRSFTIPANMSMYDFFMKSIHNEGYRFYQERDKAYIKKIDFNKLELAKIEKEDLEYSNNVSNNEYGFKIHDHDIISNPVMQSNDEKPVVTHMSYDPSLKSINKTTNNLSNVYNTMELNKKEPPDKPKIANAPQETTVATAQQTTGSKFVTDFDVNANKQKVEVENTFIKNNGIVIVVPGNYKYNKIGQLVKVTLKGNPMITDSSIEGDVSNSGKYFVAGVHDRYIGDKLIQKLTLYRVDMQAPRIKN